MLIPLYGFLKGDTLGVVVLVHHDEPVGRIAAGVMQAASPRVRPAAHAAVIFAGRELPAHITVGEAGLEPLDRVDVHPAHNGERLP